MRIRLNVPSAVPVYRQIAQQVTSAIRSGRVCAGEPLPAIRPLAARLGVGRSAVHNAYRELARQGVIDSRQGRESVVRRRV